MAGSIRDGKTSLKTLFGKIRSKTLEKETETQPPTYQEKVGKSSDCGDTASNAILIWHLIKLNPLFNLTRERFPNGYLMPPTKI